MSWITDLINGEIAEQKKATEAEQPTAGQSEAEELKTMLRDLIREEVKELVTAEVKAATVPEPEPADAKQPEAPQPDIKAEIKKALAESLNSIPAKQRSIEESYDRIFNS